jgi:DUF1680 family protein
MTSPHVRLATTIAPVMPKSSIAHLRPLGIGAISLDGGFWAERRRRNQEVTIPHGLAQLRRMGHLDNFRLASRTGNGRYVAELDDAGRAFPFLDTDVYKWLEAVGWALSVDPNDELAARASEVINLVAGAQRDDGYLDTYFQVAARGREFTDLEWGHELYTLGHLVQAAIAWHRGLGDERLLAIARRAVERVRQEMGPGRRELVDGHPEIEMALVELYRTTGEPQYLELARLFVERRGKGLLGAGRFGPRYWQDHQTVGEAREPAGHAVRQLYLDCGVVDVAIETGDENLLAAVVRRWDAMVSSRTYLTGGLGSRQRDEAFGDAFELPPDLAYAETCAAIASVMLAWRLLLATGQARFADLIERTMYNAVLAGISLGGDAFFYSNPLQRRSGGAIIQAGPTTSRRAPWFACACCPPNLMRSLATMPDMVATSDDRGIQIHQYASGRIHAELAEGTVTLSIVTNYPWDGDVRLTVEAAPDEEWTLALRVPGWCGGALLNLPGGSRRMGPGYAEARRSWAPGDEVTLSLDMAARLTLPDERIDAVRGTVAVERGPIVYALEEADLPAGFMFESIELDIAVPPTVHQVQDPALPGLITLDVAVWSRDDSASSEWPYKPTTGDWAEALSGPATMRAIPYFAWGNRTPGGMRVWIPVEAGSRHGR